MCKDPVKMAISKMALFQRPRVARAVCDFAMTIVSIITQSDSEIRLTGKSGEQRALLGPAVLRLARGPPARPVEQRRVGSDDGAATQRRADGARGQLAVSRTATRELRAAPLHVCCSSARHMDVGGSGPGIHLRRLQVNGHAVGCPGREPALI